MSWFLCFVSFILLMNSSFAYFFFKNTGLGHTEEIKALMLVSLVSCAVFYQMAVGG